MFCKSKRKHSCPCISPPTYGNSGLTCLGAGNQSIIDRGRLLVNELRVVQSAFNATHPGYLSAFPIQHFERLFDLQPVWAPFYVVSSQA